MSEWQGVERRRRRKRRSGRLIEWINSTSASSDWLSSKLACTNIPRDTKTMEREKRNDMSFSRKRSFTFGAYGGWVNLNFKFLKNRKKWIICNQIHLEDPACLRKSFPTAVFFLCSQCWQIHVWGWDEVRVYSSCLVTRSFVFVS